MKKSSRLLYCWSCVFLSFYFFSCASSAIVEPQNSFGVLGADADIYVYIPVKEHTELLKGFFSSFIESNDLDTFFKRSTSIFASLHNEELRFLSHGNYPRALAPALFKKSDGWKKTKSESGTYYTNKNLKVAIPASHHLLAMRREKLTSTQTQMPAQDMSAMLARLRKPDVIALSEAFLQRTVHSASADIGLYIKDAKKFFYHLLGFELGLQFLDMELYCKKVANASSGKEYSLSFALNVAGQIPSKAVVSLLFSRILQADVSIQNNTIFVSKAFISEAQLQALIKSLIDL